MQVSPWWGEFCLKTTKPFATAEVTAGEVEIICEGLHHLPSGKILDLGCGNGRHIPGVCEALKRNCIGVDFDVTSLDEARANGCDCVQADVCDLPFPDDSVAAAWCWSNTAYCFSPLIRERMFREVSRVLRPTGRFLTQSTSPEVAKMCGDAGFHEETLADGMLLVDGYVWDGEKLHITRSVTSGDSVETSQLAIWCPPDNVLVEETKRHGMKVLQLKDHGLQRVLTAVKT